MKLHLLCSVISSVLVLSCGGTVSSSKTEPPLTPPAPPEEPEVGGFSVIAFETRGLSIPGLDLDHFEVVTLDLQKNEYERLRPPVVGDLFWAEEPAVSADGRFVVFAFKAMTMAGGFDSGVWKYDRQLKTYERVSVSGVGSPPEPQPMKDSLEPSMSDDGKVVVFSSFQTNLVPGEETLGRNIFFKDFQTTLLYWLSRPAIGPALVNTARAVGDILTAQPRISSDGRYVVYASNATNLIPGVDDGEWDVFLFDRSLGVTERVSIRSDGTDAKSHAWDPQLSDDGSLVTFQTLTNHYLHYDYRPFNATVGQRCWGRENDPSYENVHWLCGATQILIRDRRQNRIEAVSLDPTGRMAASGRTSGAKISRDGRFVAFYSSAVNLKLIPHINTFPSGGAGPTLFLRDRQTQETIQIGGVAPRGLQISPDGRALFFISEGQGFIARTIEKRVRRVF